MKIKEILNEGTWSAPQSLKQAQTLAKLMRKPIPAGNADDLYGLVGDDDLFDQIDETKEKDGPDTDVRYLVAYKLKEWISKMDFRRKDASWEEHGDHNFGWRKPWNRKALAILKRIVKRFDT